MDITPYVESLRHDLAAAADAGGPEARTAAERLALALEPAMRMALMELLSQAAAEITGELGAGSVEVRLRGREPELVVDVPTVPTPGPTPTPALASPGQAAARASAEDAPAADDEDEDGGTARITLRLPESVKYRAEELAAKGGYSLNGWLVNVVRAATRERAVTVDVDLSSLPFVEGLPSRPHTPKRMTGWV